LTTVLEQSGARVATALVGAEYARRASGAHTVNPTRAEDFVRLLQDATTALQGSLDGVVHLWSIDAQLHRAVDVQSLRERTAHLQGSLLHLGQALLKANHAATSLWVVTRGGVAIGDQPVAPLAAATWGWARALRLEYPDWRCVSVDLDPGDEVASTQALAATLARDDDETQIAWRQRTSHIARLGRARFGSPSESAYSPDTAPLRLTARSRGVLDNLALESLQRTAPGPGQVEIRVRAAGLNFRDVLSVLDMYPGDQGPLGSECAGQVAAIGAGVDSVRVGDEVVAIAPGAFATHVIADARLVVPRPRAMSCAEAASLPNVFLTAQWALERLGGMKAGDRVLIHAAAGGVGLAAIQLAKRAGAEIFATAGSDEKRDYLRSLGIRHIFNSRSLEFAEQIRSVTDGRGVDLVLNSLAGDFIDASISVVAHGGVFLEIGRTGIWTPERVRATRPDIDYHTIDLGKDYAATPEIIRPMLISLLDDVASGRLQRPPLRTFALRDAAAAYRHMAQARHIGKLVLTQPWTAGGEAPQIREDASYLITGGLTGLGLATAGWLVDRGARSLVLMGRRAPQTGAQKVLDTFSQRGVQILIVQGDVSSERDVAQLAAQLNADAVPPLAGVVHAAGSLDDGVLTAQSMERYAKVFAAKVYGAWLIDRATRNRSLDFLIFFSSAAGLLGSAGQTNHAAANAYLDALAVQLRAEGRPAVSIQWGAWSQIGAAAGDDLAARLAEAGLEPIAPAQGLKAFAKVLQHAPANIGVVSANWNRIAERWPPKLRSYAAELIETRASAPAPRADSKKDAASGGDLNARLAATPVKKRRALLQAEIRSLAIKVLSLPATHSIDQKAPLNGLGLDSLMAVELRNLLGRTIGRSLPATLLFDHPSIEALTSHLATLLNIEPQGVVAASSPQPSGQGGADLLDQVEQLSEEELDRLLAAKMKVH
jgi:polyketide synthase 12/myxalamid-type polyketide synthase MxaB